MRDARRHAAALRGSAGALVALAVLASLPSCGPASHADTPAPRSGAGANGSRSGASLDAPARTTNAVAPERAQAQIAPDRSRLASVERAVDGDTFVLAGGERVRILGIDAPEVHDASPVLRDLAATATTELSRRIAGRVVRLLVADPPLDRFGRTLAYVEVGDGADRDVGAALLTAGLARTYPTQHPRLDAYLALEGAARSAGRGVWATEAREAWGPRAELVISPAEAAANVGKIARVEGRLAAARRTDRGLFLDVARDGATLSVVTFHLPLFPESLVETWKGRDVAVTGRIEMYRDRPEIVLNRPDQVELPARDGQP